MLILFLSRVKALGALSTGFALLLGLMVANHSAHAEARVALVIGNSAYQGDLPALTNPANDAKLMVSALQSVGFDVVFALDASKDKMIEAIQQFSDKMVKSGSNPTGLFFYAGHGLQVAGVNYLIPVDAKIQAEKDVQLAAISADTVMDQMEFAQPGVKIIILDACRNNPLGDGARGVSRGLAKMEAATTGTFLAYSTAPGKTAADGDGVNSPYTKALAETITQPGLSIADVFQEVRTKVLASTGNEQTPWDSSSLTGRFYFKAPDATQNASVAPPPAAPATSPEEAKLKNEKAYWDSVKDTGDPDQVQLYLDKYPQGYFVEVANAKIAELKDGTKVASAEPAPDSRQSIQPPQAPAAQTAQVAIIGMPDQTIYASTSGASVRAAPSTEAEVVSKLSKNEEIIANGETKDGKWWRVKVGDTDAYISKKVASTQPVAPASTAQAAQPQAPTQTAQVQTAEADGRGLEMLGGGDSAPAAPTNNGADMAALGNAIQSGNLGQAGSALNSLFGGGQASNAQQAALPQVQFQEMNKTVTVKRGAVIQVEPIYNAAAIAKATQETKVQATGRTANNLWWQVLLPTGQVGYVQGKMILQ